MSAYTDPDRIRATDPGKIEGNTVFLYHDLINEDKELVEEMKDKYKNGNIGDVEVKENLYNAHIKYFSEAREKRKMLEKDINVVKEILRDGAKRASAVANETLSEVYEVIGINNKLNN
jgi:tryptophanyl-tRNA synthetase